MSYNILPTHKFEKELKRLVKKFPSLKRDFALFLNDITKEPQTGTLIGNNCYKVRIAIASKGKGKSGGARIITYVYVHAKIVYLLTIYDKSEISTIQSKDLKSMVKALKL